MIKKLILPFLFVACVVAQSIVTIEQGTVVELTYDHPQHLATVLYTNGVAAKTFSAPEVRRVGTNSIVSLAGMDTRGTINFTVTVVDGGVESDPSNIVSVQFRPKKPGNLKRFLP